MTAPSEIPLVFIVDAEAVNCRLFDAKLTRNGEFRVSCATNGTAALRLASQESFAVLLWDMRLRETLSLLPQIRAYCPQSALLLTTTDDRLTVPLALQRLDIADILVKPLNLDTLLQRVRHALAVPPQSMTAASLELVAVGQQIVLRRNTGTCITRVISVTQDTFAVAAPPRVEAPADFTLGAFVRVAIPADDAVYSFETTILERTDAPVPQWQIALPQTLHREQRRRFPRAIVQTAVTLSPCAAESIVPIEAITRDISVGGFALVSAEAITPGTEVAFDLKPSGEENLVGVGRVIRTVPRTSLLETASQYESAVEITSLPSPAEQRLRLLIEKTEE